MFKKYFCDNILVLNGWCEEMIIIEVVCMESIIDEYLLSIQTTSIW